MTVPIGSAVRRAIPAPYGPNETKCASDAITDLLRTKVLA